MSRPVALVTGGSRGIGLAIAEHLFRAGFDLAINGVRDEAEIGDLLDRFDGAGARAVYCRGDVGAGADREAILARVRSELGRLDVLVNNAGVAPRERLDPLEGTEASFERLMRINLQGPYFLTQLAARWMIEQKRANPAFAGSIINIGSISATVVSPERGDYCISKAGLAMHSRIWAVRMAEFGIPVYEVRPGVIRTDMTAGVEAKYDRLIAGGLTVQPRWGSPDDVGRAVLSLARGDLPYSTGEVIMVDGGLTIQRL